MCDNDATSLFCVSLAQRRDCNTLFKKQQQRHNYISSRPAFLHDVWKVWWWLFTVFHIFSLKLHPDILVKRDRLVRCCCKVRFHQFIQTRHRVNAVAAWYCSKGRRKFILSISTFFSKCKFRIKISLFHLGLTFFSPSLIVATLLCTFKMRDRSKLTRISAISTCWWAFNSAGISH